MSKQASSFTRSSKQYKYAGFGRRFLAYWVDFVVLFPIGLIVQQMLGVNALAIFDTQSLEQLQQLQQANSSGLSTIFSMVLAFAFFMIMWVNFDGATPGKKLMAIKIIKNDGSKVTYPTAFIRYLGYILSAAFFMLGYFWILWDKKKQGWHDKVAGTIVVKTNEKPKTFLAIVLTLIAMFCMTGYIVATTIHGIKLGAEAIKNQGYENRQLQSIEQNKNNMSAEAKIHYNKTQELFPQMRELADSPEAIKPLANQTIKEAQLAVDSEPTNPLLWNNLGNAYSWPNTLGGDQESLDAYKKAEELNPSDVLSINNVGGQLNRMGKFEEAVLQYQKALRLTEKSGYTYLGIAQAYTGLKIYDEARNHFNKAIEIFQAANSEGEFDDEILNAQKIIASFPR